MTRVLDKSFISKDESWDVPGDFLERIEGVLDTTRNDDSANEDNMFWKPNDKQYVLRVTVDEIDA